MRGAGIGLALAQKLAQLLLGEIAAAPRLGGGSVFQLVLPLRVHAAALAATATRSSARQLEGRVRLAEDGEDDRVLITRILQRAGVCIDQAENGREAHAKAMSVLLSATPYDVALMDMQIPEMTGEACAAGCDDYATKPIDRETLVGRMARFLETRGA